MQLQKAKRTLAKVKLAIGGPSGTGKTMSSLLLGYGLIKASHPNWTDEQCWDKICIIDTENGSASLYVDTTVGAYRTGEYFTIPMEPPYDFEKYENAIHAAENGGMEVIIIDSLTHVWKGEGGALDMQGKAAARSGNSYTAWRDVTPKLNHLMDVILQSNCHIISNIRAKTDYVQEKNSAGKTVVKNIGMGLEMRDGTEFEFSTVFMLDQDHVATVSKDRTGLFDGKYFVITPETGKQIYQWLASGNAEPPKSLPTPVPAAHPAPIARVTMEQVDTAIRAACEKRDKKEVFAEVKQIAGVNNYTTITDPEILSKLYAHFAE